MKIGTKDIQISIFIFSLVISYHLYTLRLLDNKLDKKVFEIEKLLIDEKIMANNKLIELKLEILDDKLDILIEHLKEE